MESIGNNEAERLRGYVERVARLTIEKREKDEDIKEILNGEAKPAGYDPALIKEMVKEMLMTDAARLKAEAKEEKRAMYRRALGGLADMPLGAAALASVQ